MANIFGVLGEGKTVRAFAAGAAVASLAATVVGFEAERIAQFGGSTIVGSLFPRPQASWRSGGLVNAIDLATTGSIRTEGQAQLFVLGPCGDQADRR